MLELVEQVPLTMDGGTFRLTNDNTYTGATILNSGKLAIGTSGGALVLLHLSRFYLMAVTFIFEEMEILLIREL